MEETQRLNDVLLTVLIPTYNRQEALIKTLDSLSKQSVSCFKVFILDNGSPYSIGNMLDNFSKDFADRCCFYQRPMNAGINANITELFGYCDTKWAWTLSDDDELFENSVELIMRWIKINEGAGCIHFSILDNSPIEKGKQVVLNDIHQFVEYFEKLDTKNSLRHGDLIFLSNKVYNMEFAKKHVYEECLYAYHYLATLTVVVRMFSETSYVVVNERICNHGVDAKLTKAPGWNFFQAYLAVRTFFDIPMQIEEKVYYRLMRIILFDIRDLLYVCFVLDNKEDNLIYSKRDYFLQLYYGGYRYVLPFKQKILLYVVARLMNNRHVKITKKLVGHIYKMIE